MSHGISIDDEKAGSPAATAAVPAGGRAAAPQRSPLVSWAGKGALTLADQGLISGSNFAVAVLLARWLPPEEYGAYAIAMSLFLLLANVHQALILEPFMVLHDTRRREGLGSVFTINLLLCGLFVVVLAAAGLAFQAAGQRSLGSALEGLAFAVPFLFSFWLLRAASYVKQTPGPAALVSALYCGVLAGGVLLARQLGVLSPPLVFAAMAAGSLGAAVVLGYALRWRFSEPGVRRDMADTSRRHWSYGRWALGTAGVMWMHVNGFTPAIGVLLGVREAGALAAVMNFFLPIGSIFNALGRLFLPHLSQAFAGQGAAAVKRKIRIFGLLIFGGTMVYAAAMTVLRDQLFAVFYAGKFDAFTYLVPGLMLSAVLSTTAAATDVGLRAMRAPSSVFIVNSVAAAVSLLFGWSATYWFGLSGTILSLICSGGAALAASVFLLRRRLGQASAVEV